MLNLTPYSRGSSSLFRLLNDVEKNLFDSTINPSFNFRCDIRDKGDHYLVEAELPGFNKEDININVENDFLTISASTKNETEEKDTEGNYVRRERRHGSFTRGFSTKGIDIEQIKAEYNNGILDLVLPKIKEELPQTRKIEIGSPNA